MSMSGKKRQRELARAKYERQQARRAQAVDRRKRNQKIIAVVVVAALVLGGVGWIVASAVNRSSTPESIESAAPSAEATPTDGAISSEASPAEPIEEPAVLDCRAPGTPRPDDLTFDAAPTDLTAETLTLSTNCGDIVIALDSGAPQTVSSEVFLAREGFYDNTTCHRLTTAGIFVLQCGDPVGTGIGGPGYTVPDENLPAEGANNYPAGTVAMANAGPGTSGSQFFIVYDDTTLPSGYTIWGTVTSGLDLVQEVASVGTADGGSDGAPRQPVFIESATVQPSS
jgi:peptidyl-prolyl cis-trans isomerase B (cyclophilin B)